jgi:hypothetical protein
MNRQAPEVHVPRTFLAKGAVNPRWPTRPEGRWTPLNVTRPDVVTLRGLPPSNEKEQSK